MQTFFFISSSVNLSLYSGHSTIHHNILFSDILLSYLPKSTGVIVTQLKLQIWVTTKSVSKSCTWHFLYKKMVKSLCLRWGDMTWYRTTQYKQSFLKDKEFYFKTWCNLLSFEGHQRDRGQEKTLSIQTEAGEFDRQSMKESKDLREQCPHCNGKWEVCLCVGLGSGGTERQEGIADIVAYFWKERKTIRKCCECLHIHFLHRLICKKT